MKMLDLFAGTRSVSRAFEKAGWETYSVEWDKKFKDISLYADISKLTADDIIELCGGRPDVIWASPDCSSYSVAAIFYHREKVGDTLRPKTEYAQFCDRTNAHVLDLIEELDPKYFFIENPRAGLRKMDFMRERESEGFMTRYTVTYCQYNNPYVQELIFNMTEKKCPKCGMVKDIGEFYACKSRRDGFTSWCKSCSNNSHKDYVENNREHLREYDRMQYYAKHEEHLQNRRESNERNKESIKIARKKYYNENREEILRKDKEYYENNRDYALKNMHEYYVNHSDEIKEKAIMRKRTIRGTSDGTVTKDALEKMFEEQDRKCGYCGQEITKQSNKPNTRHLDHIVPISRGGMNTLSNVHWVCPQCNKSKGGRLEEEWLKKERMKPTDIWTNHPDPKFRPPCHYGDLCHEKAPRGTKLGTQAIKGSMDRARIPEQLCEHIVKICGDIQ